MKNSFAGNIFNKLLIVELVLVRTQAYNFLMWFPYYFEKMGFEFSLTFISSCFYLMFIPGAIMFEQIMAAIPSERCQRHINCFFLFLSLTLTMSLSFVEAKEENTALYILILCLIGLTQSGPSGQTYGAEFVKTFDNVRIRYYCFNLFKLLQMTFAFFSMVLIGFLI